MTQKLLDNNFKGLKWLKSELFQNDADVPRYILNIVKLRQGSGKDGKDGKDGQGWARMALKAKGLKALNPCQELTLKLVATTTHHHHPPPPKSLITPN